MAEIDRTHIETFLFADENSHAKESLLNNKLIFDLKLAAVERGYFLNVYRPEVDKDGFDLIFDDQDTLAKVQLKTVMKTATTKSWQIHKSLIRPLPGTCGDLGFEMSPTGCGYQGGIILLEIDAGENGFCVDYYYTDIILLAGIADEIITLKDAPSSKALKTLFESMVSGISTDRITIYKNMFLRANSASSLLALMGLHNNMSTTSWRYHIQKMVKPYNESELPAPYAFLKTEINKELNEISTSIAVE